MPSESPQTEELRLISAIGEAANNGARSFSPTMLADPFRELWCPYSIGEFRHVWWRGFLAQALVYLIDQLAEIHSLYEPSPQKALERFVSRRDWERKGGDA